MDKEIILAGLLSGIILAVGVFAFFTTIDSISQETITETELSFFNIVGIALIIGAVMVMVGLIYFWIRAPLYSEEEDEEDTDISEGHQYDYFDDDKHERLTAKQIAQRRFAKGLISKEEYTEIMSRL